MLTGAVVVGSGDVIAQKLSKKKEKFDVKRLASTAGYGFFVSGGIGHLWYKALDNFYGQSMTISNSLKKVCTDQLLLAPPSIILFLAWAHYSKNSQTGFLDVLKENFLGLLIKNYMIWIPGQFCNFYLIPQKHRVLFVCGVNVFWFSLLSFTSYENTN